MSAPDGLICFLIFILSGLAIAERKLKTLLAQNMN